jgi:hypothetical protein
MTCNNYEDDDTPPHITPARNIRESDPTIGGRFKEVQGLNSVTVRLIILHVLLAVLLIIHYWR